MREAGEDLLRSFPAFVSISGTAEATVLSPSSVDFVTAGQAAHWFDVAKARREFSRIAKPGGWLVLAWNERLKETTPLLKDYEELLRAFCPEYAESHTLGATNELDVEPFFAPAQPLVRSFSNHQVFDYVGFRGRLLSSSYTPQEGDPNYVPMLNELRRIFDRHQTGGQVTLEYETRLYYGRVS
jgi:SAM-dependent methyltransferase